MPGHSWLGLVARIAHSVAGIVAIPMLFEGAVNHPIHARSVLGINRTIVGKIRRKGRGVTRVPHARGCLAPLYKSLCKFSCITMHLNTFEAKFVGTLIDLRNAGPGVIGESCLC